MKIQLLSDLHLEANPGFTATLVAVDGTRVASGRDFDDTGTVTRDVVVLDEPTVRGLASALDGDVASYRCEG